MSDTDIFEDYIVFDLETSIKQDDKNFFKADPFHAENNIVLYAEIASRNGIKNFNFDYMTKLPADKLLFVSKNKVIVGHNVKFDLLYVFFRYGVEKFEEWYKNGGRIWDTMLAEYMIENCAVKFPSLNYCSEKYGGVLKDDKIKEYWDNGVDTEDIPKSELLQYGKTDVENTNLIYEEQIKYLQNHPVLCMNIIAQMDALTATLMMEWEGMHFNVDKAKHYAKLESVKIATAERTARGLLRAVYPKMPKDYHPNLMSPTQLSSLIWRQGDLNYVVDQELYDDNGVPVVWKSGAKKGQPRTKKVTLKWTPKIKYDFTLEFVESKHCKVKNAKKLAKLPTGEEVLMSLQKYLLDNSARYIRAKLWVDLIDVILELRGRKKEVNTYLLGYSKVCREWGTIHPSYNHCVTPTGRLSCSGPNLQNVTKKTEE